MQGEQCWDRPLPEAASAVPPSWKGGWKTRARADSTEQELIQIIMQMSRHARSVTLGYLHTPPLPLPGRDWGCCSTSAPQGMWGRLHSSSSHGLGCLGHSCNTHSLGLLNPGAAAASSTEDT